MAQTGSWTPRRIFPGRARPLLEEGRRALKGGARDEGMALLRAACILDPSVYCKPWGLMPLLKAEGRDRLRPRMLERLQDWYRAPRSRVHAHVARLTQKEEMRLYIEDLGLPLPQLWQQVPDLEALDWAALPQRVVLKPVNGASSKGVVVAAEGRDHMAQAAITPDLETYAKALYGCLFETPPQILAEEMLEDVAAQTDPALVIPRDFKAYAVAGDVAFVRVHDRNAADGKRNMMTLDRQGRRLPAALVGWPEAPGADGMATETVPPAGYDALIAMAEYLSARLPVLLRLDFYLTSSGPVFGEFTTFPNAGLDHTGFGRRTVLQMWEAWPD
ncbi:ATP-grasp fold amidoligase family protein [Phaeobacter gallaeciensis]|uniref:ATP-grasp fold amidoligase family protein n=1 Tax=Phaeobacter gallaeciensis TaxID=60890 RepID=UPI00237FD097|nr:ATP-grasp fold amidoligase family protein [Phaeobacter gallaeciensis]MDE4142356.1 ATP-grasp fold amidoligase family protein [Phaeobacter gallaeciensis]MDE4150801.1 ATP-grasp fold amidoligase family protein [Phaeobacter gallaeciensis]MDE4155030.1 ATP-grasp fold amidoligase family protein [Phaeobacter gallaeciensis]MDE4230420.1 ATP-grasp fold amidoligase family protein [Phaeobacter gallaeciensis]MDE4259497.1 ATP-grasp fold amidoligase family protein [Phaeobacter gallaeciensis]